MHPIENRGALIQHDAISMTRAQVSNHIAPEHALSCLVAETARRLKKISHAGAVFLGAPRAGSLR